MSGLDIIDAIANGPEGYGHEPVTLCGIHPISFERVVDEFTLQFWPESLQDSPEIGWDFKELPGATHALAQWSSNGGRTFTFDVRLNRYMRPYEDLSNINKGLNTLNRPGDGGIDVDVAYEIRRLRALAYPSYEVGETGVSSSLVGEDLAVSPVIVLAHFPNMQLSEDGADTFWSVMTTCDATYNLSFPDGTPRQAVVNVVLRQIIQKGKDQGVQFREHDRNALYNNQAGDQETGLPNRGPWSPTNIYDEK